MCGRGRNKPSWGGPHFLIASCSPCYRARRREPNSGETERDGKWARFIVSLFIRSRERCCWTDCKWRRVYVRTHREHTTFRRSFRAFLPLPLLSPSPAIAWHCESSSRVVDLRAFQQCRYLPEFCGNAITTFSSFREIWSMNEKGQFGFGAIHKSWSSWSYVRTIYYHWSWENSKENFYKSIVCVLCKFGRLIKIFY